MFSFKLWAVWSFLQERPGRALCCVTSRISTQRNKAAASRVWSVVCSCSYHHGLHPQRDHHEESKRSDVLKLKSCSHCYVHAFVCSKVLQVALGFCAVVVAQPCVTAGLIWCLVLQHHHLQSEHCVMLPGCSVPLIALLQPINILHEHYVNIPFIVCWVFFNLELWECNKKAVYGTCRSMVSSLRNIIVMVDCSCDSDGRT